MRVPDPLPADAPGFRRSTGPEWTRARQGELPDDNERAPLAVAAADPAARRLESIAPQERALWLGPRLYSHRPPGNFVNLEQTGRLPGSKILFIMNRCPEVQTSIYSGKTSG